VRFRLVPTDAARTKAVRANAYGDPFGAFKVYFGTGIDGIFSDTADTALLARQDFVNGA
jgi:glycerophosphoryl diester phosphodiesterase